MKETASKDNSGSVHFPKPFFPPKKEGSFFAQNQEAERPFFSPDISRRTGGDYHTPHTPFFQAKPQPTIQARQATLQQIARQSLNASNQTQLTPLFAGIPRRMAAPGGINNIVGRSSGGSLGRAAGLTLRKNAAAFTAPNFQTTNQHQRMANGTVEHFATVQPTQSPDVIHESFYPGPGDHDFPISTPQSGRRQFRHYYRISLTLADLIRQGEQEHLDDLQRAYDLTYGLIAWVINQMGQRRFGPASTPGRAHQLAEQELTRLLPPALGGHPSNWPIMLDRLLDMTELRDQQGWHSLSNGPPVTNRNKVFHPLQQTPTFNVGQVSSAQVVNY